MHVVHPKHNTCCMKHAAYSILVKHNEYQHSLIETWDDKEFNLSLVLLTFNTSIALREHMYACNINKSINFYPIIICILLNILIHKTLTSWVSNHTSGAT